MDILKFKKSEEIKKESKTYLQTWDKAHNTKSNRMVRTRSAIDKQMNKLSNKVATSKMSNKERRKYFAQLNK